MAGGKGEAAGLCTEYVLVGDKVVYMISGKSSEQLMPFAEVTRFRLLKNEMLIRIEDGPKESRFHIKAMVHPCLGARSRPFPCSLDCGISLFVISITIGCDVRRSCKISTAAM
jgi:hypothetical protein